MKLYSTVFSEARAEQEIERSKFITTVRPVDTREEAEEFFAEVRKEFKDATKSVWEKEKSTIGEEFYNEFIEKVDQYR